MKKVDFLFEYEVKQRELDSICLIAAYLKKKGYSVAFVNSWQSMYENVPRYKAEVMVLSACYNDGVYGSFAGLATKFQKVVNMQWEQVLTNKMYAAHKPNPCDFKETGLITRHVCWGESEKRWLNEFWGIDECYTKVVGFPALDFYRKEFKSLLIPREELFFKYGLDPQKKTILFVSSFSIVDMPDSELAGASSSFHDYMRASYESQDALLGWFRRFLQEHPDVQLIYRFHPAEKNNPRIVELSRQYPNFFTIAELPIRHWITACDKLLNWSSTSLIEMYCSGKETYILRPTELPFNEDMVIFQDARTLTTYEEFSRICSEYPGFPVPAEKLLSWYSITDEPIYKRIGDWLIETYHCADYQSPPVKSFLHRTNPLLKAVIKAIKKSPAIPCLASVAHRFIPSSVLSKKLSSYSETICKEQMHEDEKMATSGYMFEKYRQNAFDPTQADALIATYSKIISKGD